MATSPQILLNEIKKKFIEMEKENIKLKKENKKLKEIKEIYDSLEDALYHFGGFWNDEIGSCYECEKYKGFDDLFDWVDCSEYHCIDCIEKINRKKYDNIVGKIQSMGKK